ncbi:hypothetical protein GGI04_000711 [Coemansia thaxteri]|uniref:Uncharacterized protein n=1 Tax=Coemansia thaxteri TaxID=2663907 RepID=A0A9W8BNF6_9FUNG|nr:hypothetical protein H4R26_000675 [Coemansia thaxteri]KAJ2009110.1 hypothetical protein GGI04_000711 [Coemansia thaxteri]KAJ2474043.1 hypothetical protein GGI02_000389 [Coemansia sp. RSA 2322]KAJ2486931.1 hypothetical protein EV174_000831 [Coemansia sp. RSA 2320]
MATRLLPLQVLLLAALTLLFALVPAAGAADQSHRLSVRATAADISNFRGAILVKNGQPTSCELALIDNHSAFVAANCLDYTSDGQVDLNTRYEVYFDNAKGNAPGKATIQSNRIFVHPLYLHTTLANNIAAVGFDYNDQGEWTNFISVNNLEWKDVVHVRRQLLNTNSMSWNTPVVKSQLKMDPGCTKASKLFDSNQRDMLCTKLSLSSPVSSKCLVPYGTLYGVSSKSMAVSAIYSHTVVYASDTCSNGNTFNYYTMLSNYTRYASYVLGRKVYEYIEKPDLYDTMPHTTGHHFQNVNAQNDAGTSQFGGDIYAIQRDLLFPQPSVPPPKPQTSQQPQPPQPPASTPGNNGGGGASPAPSPPAPRSTNGASTNPPQQQPSSSSNNNNNNSGGGGSSSSTASTTDNGDDNGFTMAPIGGSENGNSPTDAITLIDPADLLSDSFVVPVSASETDTDIFDGGNGTGGNGGGSGGNIGGGGGNKSSASSSRGTNTATSTGTSQSAGQVAESSNEGYGLPKKTVIALGVSLPILFVLLGIGAYMLYRTYKKRRADREWTPGSSRLRNNMRVIMEEIGGASDSLNLPAYADPEKPYHNISDPTETKLLGSKRT